MPTTAKPPEACERVRGHASEPGATPMSPVRHEAASWASGRHLMMDTPGSPGGHRGVSQAARHHPGYLITLRNDKTPAIVRIGSP